MARSGHGAHCRRAGRVFDRGRRPGVAAAAAKSSRHGGGEQRGGPHLWSFKAARKSRAVAAASGTSEYTGGMDVLPTQRRRRPPTRLRVVPAQQRAPQLSPRRSDRRLCAGEIRAPSAASGMRRATAAASLLDLFKTAIGKPLPARYARVRLDGRCPSFSLVGRQPNNGAKICP